MLLHFLLKHEGYPPAFVLALLLHAVLIWFLLDRGFEPQEIITVKPMQVSAATAKENPQRLRRIEQVQQQRASDQRARDEARAREQATREREAQQKAEAERQRQAQQRREDQQRQEQARKAEEDRAAAARRQADEEQTRRRQAEQQRQREIEQQQRQRAEAEAQRQAQANAAASSAENDIVSQYMALIQQLIQENWVIPPSARNGMAALVEIRTTPIGDITAYTIIQSSGDPTFDRSVLQAVASVGNLQELRDLTNAVYERNFRRFNLLFQPEDLLR